MVSANRLNRRSAARRRTASTAAALRQSLARFSIDHRRFLVPDIGETLSID
jgi:hypothetical protein